MSYLNPTSSIIDLGVNIDHVATLRNARGTSYPDPLKAALLAEEAGADAITLHLREDRRHIRDADVEAIRPQLRTRMNLEAAVTAEMLDFACRIRPQDVCLVPERRHEVTTEGGLDVRKYFSQVQGAVRQLQAEGIRVSLFIDPEAEQIQAAQESGAPVIELHTGRYANAAPRRRTAGGTGARAARGAGRRAAWPDGECRPRPALHQHAGDRRDGRYHRIEYRPCDRRPGLVRRLGKRGARDEGADGGGAPARRSVTRGGA